MKKKYSKVKRVIQHRADIVSYGQDKPSRP